MRKISLTLIVLGLSVTPLLANVISSSNTQDSSYESGKQIGEAVSAAKIKADKVWQETKANSKEAVTYVKDRSVQVEEATAVKYHQVAQATSTIADKTKIKASETWEAIKANSEEAMAYVKNKSIHAKDAAIKASHKVVDSTSEAVNNFDQGIKDGNRKISN